ncbi:MAG: hypothetical protein QXG00_04660 [Candidatus Woesearchaeota archaeon]
MTTRSDLIDNLSFRDNKKEYFLTYLSVALLNPTFGYYDIFHILFTTIIIYLFINSRLKFDNLFFWIITLLNFVAIAQFFAFGAFTTSSYIGVFLTFLMPYFIIRIIGYEYWRYYINIVYFFSIISLILWSLQNISDSFTALLINISSSLHLDPENNESLIIYNLEHKRPTDILGLMKNAGFTAEGGVFSCLLILALFFNTIYSKNIFNKKNIVFIISLLSTNSTAGYAALGIYLTGTSFLFSQKRYKLILFPITAVLFYLAIIQLPFMLEKVNKYYEDELYVYEINPNPSRLGRFLSARIDLDIIKENPLWGRGIHKESRYLTPLEKEIGYSNSYLGIIGFASRYGIIIWSYFFYYLFVFVYKKSRINKINKYYSIIFLLAILATAMGQNPFTNPPYLILAYSGYYSSK